MGNSVMRLFGWQRLGSDGFDLHRGDGCFALGTFAIVYITNYVDADKNGLVLVSSALRNRQRSMRQQRTPSFLFPLGVLVP